MSTVKPRCHLLRNHFQPFVNHGWSCYITSPDRQSLLSGALYQVLYGPADTSNHEAPETG